MQLVEKHIIKKSNPLYKEIDNLCFLSKNLYNAANYLIRQQYINEGTYLNYNNLDKIMNNSDNKDYYSLPCKVSQQVLRLLDKNYKSFFRSIKEYQNNKTKFKGVPKLPGYKHKSNGRNCLIYTIQAISKKGLDQGVLHLSRTNIRIKTKVDPARINQVRILPRNMYYQVEVVYTVNEKEQKNNDNVLAIDLGVNNLASVVSNFNKDKMIINGRPLKSINQFFNKKRAKLQSFLKDKFTSNNLSKLTNKRDNKINHYLHNVSRGLINYCLANDVSKIIIGYNKEWKQCINIGKANNQTFVGIPFRKFISFIQYKARLEGISVDEHEESYTSKCSFIDDEAIHKHKCYLGKRIKRGLFKSQRGYVINADINAAFNILKKVIPTFSIRDYGIEGVVVHPVKHCYV